jgi:hypothetical protein
MVVFDTEDSMSNILDNNSKLNLEFGAYVPMYKRFSVDEDLLGRIAKGSLPWVSNKQKGALVEYYEFMVAELDRVLSKGKFEYLVWDTVEPLEASMAAWAEQNRGLSGWSGQRAFGRLETEAIRPLIENLFEAVARRGIKYILLTSHLRRLWEGERPVPNKVAPGGRLTLLSRLSTMMLWLSPGVGNTDGAPAAIVLKARKAVETIENDNWVVRRSLPERIPHFTWEDVRRYERDGCDMENPAPGEVMTASERDMVSEFLSDAQMRLMTLGAEMDLETAKAQAMPFMGSGEAFSIGADTTTAIAPEVVEQIIALAGEGLKPVQIKTQLGVSIKDVLETLKGIGK